MKPFRKRAPLTNRSFFRVIFALFLTAQLISLATNMVVSTFLRNWLAEDAKSYNKSVIDSLEATMNSMLTEISRLVQVTTIAADSVDQLHDYDSFTPEDYIQVQKVAQDLSFIMGAKQSISSWFYYYPEKNLVISNGSIYQAETYFSKYSFYDSLNPQRLEELIEIPSHLLLGLDIQNRWSLAGKSVSQEVVPFVTSYRNLIRQKALMIVNIQASYLYNQTLHYRTSDQMGLLIADSEGRPIVSWGLLQGPDVTASSLPQVESGEYRLTEQRLDGSPAVFLSSGCTFPNWNIYVAYSKSSFYQKSNLLFWSLTIFNLIVTLLGVGVSYLFSRRIFSPIYNLTQLLYPNTPRSSLPRRDELHLISARMKEIQQKNQALQENLQTILPSVKQYHLRELLTRPDYLSDPENRDFLENRFLLPLDRPFLLCRVFVRYRKDFLARLSPEEQEQQRSDVLDVLLTLAQTICRRTEPVLLSPDHSFFLFPLSDLTEPQTEAFPQKALAMLEEILTLFHTDRENIRVHFVLSDRIPSAYTIASRCEVLIRASQRLVRLNGENACFSLSSELPPPPADIPREQVEKLWNLLLTGEEKGVERLIRELFGPSEACSLEQAEQSCRFLSQHTNALLQELHQLPCAFPDPLSAFSCEELQQSLLTALQSVSEALKRRKPGRREAYLSFLQTNFTDCSLSIETAAAFFQLLPSAFSRNFKEEFGLSFPKYLTQLRIDRSKELLRSTALTVDEIAELVGISNRTTFNRLFNQQEGMPPGKYRTLFRSPITPDPQETKLPGSRTSATAP